MTAVSATTLNSPAVASALKAVAAAIEEEVVRNTPKEGSSAKGSSSEKADELVGSLQAEIAALKQKLAEAEKKAEGAQPQNPLAALFKCITCGLPEKWAEEAAVRLAEQKKALRLEVEPQVPLLVTIQPVDQPLKKSIKNLLLPNFSVLSNNLIRS